MHHSIRETKIQPLIPDIFRSSEILCPLLVEIMSDEVFKEWLTHTFGVIDVQFFSLRWFKLR